MRLVYFESLSSIVKQNISRRVSAFYNTRRDDKDNPIILFQEMQAEAMIVKIMNNIIQLRETYAVELQNYHEMAIQPDLLNPLHEVSAEHFILQ
ncbi:hypothetical protein [Legionella sp.]|uniref:hypothetical protein n=1 Tax=Legionella sp. TaxID=459 RepID=UPI003D1341AD